MWHPFRNGSEKWEEPGVNLWKIFSWQKKKCEALNWAASQLMCQKQGPDGQAREGRRLG